MVVERTKGLRTAVQASRIEQPLRDRLILALDRLGDLLSDAELLDATRKQSLAKYAERELEFLSSSAASPFGSSRALDQVRDLNARMAKEIRAANDADPSDARVSAIDMLIQDNQQIALERDVERLVPREPAAETKALAKAFIDRLAALRAMVDESDVDDTTREAGQRALDRLKYATESRPDLAVSGKDDARGLTIRSDIFLSRVPNELRKRAEVKLLELFRDLNSELIRTVRGYDGKVEEDLKSLVTEIELENQALAIEVARRQMSGALERAETAIERAEEAADLAQEAAGVAGATTLSEHFAKYARSERRSAETFRWLTVGAIGGAVLLAIGLPHPDSGDWVGLVYRLLITGGVAALATYFGRQASNHRRATDWATSLRVQLQSFPAFVAPIPPGETRNEVFKMLAARVLGSPPSAGDSDQAVSISPAQLAEVFTTVVKKI